METARFKQSCGKRGLNFRERTKIKWKQSIDNATASDLNAYEHYPGEDEDDAEPLTALEFLAKENPGEEDCDCSVERGQDADDGDLAGVQAGVIGNECGCIEEAYGCELPPDAAAGELEALARGDGGECEHRKAREPDHPHGDCGADGGHDIESEKPEQNAVSEGCEDGPADAF